MASRNWHKGLQTLVGPLSCRVYKGGCYATVPITLQNSRMWVVIISAKILKVIEDCDEICENLTHSRLRLPSFKSCELVLKY